MLLAFGEFNGITASGLPASPIVTSVPSGVGITIATFSSFGFDKAALAIKVTAAAAAGATTFTLPDTGGTNGQVIKTDGSGTLSFIDQWQPLITIDIICRSLGVGTSAPGAGGVGQIRAINNITSYYSSDKTLKTNIRPIANALDKVMSINGVQFEWTDDFIESEGGEDGFFIRKHDVGVIAQEIEKVLPEVVAERDDGIKAVKYDRIVALLIEAVKELKQEVDTLKNCQCGKCQ